MDMIKVGVRILMAIIILTVGGLPGMGRARPEAGTTERVSVASDGTEGNAESSYSAISADGRYVAFESYASNLVGGDTNNFCDTDGDDVYDDNCADVFVHDLLSGETSLVSVASDGTQGNEGSYGPTISADGRYVAFSSVANNLVPDDSNGKIDIFVHDRQTGETILVSVDNNGWQSNGWSYNATISADGQSVAFTSSATNLHPGDINNADDIFVRDLVNSLTHMVSVASDGTHGNSYSGWPSISEDGRYVSFDSWSTNLVGGDTNEYSDVFVHDRVSGETTRVSIASDGTQGDGDSSEADISGDGQSVAFYSTATNLVIGDANEFEDVFVHDLVSGETTLVSRASDGTPGNYGSSSTSISGDGRYVAFNSWADNLVEGDTNGYDDIFLHDRVSGETIRVSIASDGMQSDNYSWSPSVATSGSIVAFESFASNLVQGDTNLCDYDGDGEFDDNCEDVFVHELGETAVGFSISGEVTDELGNPLEGVEIACDCGLSALSNAGGSYTITNVITGSYTITATLLEYSFEPISRTVSVPPDASGQDFVGAPISSTISGRVTDATGNPLMGVSISAGEGYSATTGVQGYYWIGNVLPGTYTVTASLEGYMFEPSMRMVNVPPDAMSQDFSGSLISYAISGQVNDDEGNPLEGVSITAGEAYSTTSDIQGSYTISEVLPGTYTLTAMMEGYTFTPTERTVSVPPDASGQDFTGTLITYAISGLVTDADGNPLMGVSISAGEGYSATTDSEGFYTIEGVTPGTYTVTATLEGYTFEPGWRVVSVPPEAVGVDFTGVMEEVVIYVMLPLVVK